jgi:hypothetical protein
MECNLIGRIRWINVEHTLVYKTLLFYKPSSNETRPRIVLVEGAEAVKNSPLSVKVGNPLTTGRETLSAKKNSLGCYWNLCTTVTLTSSDPNLRPFSACLRGPNTWNHMVTGPDGTGDGPTSFSECSAACPCQCGPHADGRCTIRRNSSWASWDAFSWWRYEGLGVFHNSAVSWRWCQCPWTSAPWNDSSFAPFGRNLHLERRHLTVS